MRTQVINVPVGPGGSRQMVPKPGTETPGAVGAADIHVETFLEGQAAKLADADGRRLGRCEHEGVGSGLGIRHG